MTALLLTPAERKQKRADAHHLDPVVAIGNDGATEAVRRELDARARTPTGWSRSGCSPTTAPPARRCSAELSEALGAAPVQHIGKLLVLWREPRPKEKAERDGPDARARRWSRC